MVHETPLCNVVSQKFDIFLHIFSQKVMVQGNDLSPSFQTFVFLIFCERKEDVVVVVVEAHAEGRVLRLLRKLLRKFFDMKP